METERHVNVGSFRPKWMLSNRKSVKVHFDFSLDIPESDQLESITELRESIIELLISWSRGYWIKLQKEKDKRKMK